MKQRKRLLYNYFFLLITICIIPIYGFSQQYTLKFSHIGKIIFPSVPKYESLEADTNYTLRDSTNLYTFVIHSFRHDTDFSIDSGSSDLKDLYKDFVKKLTKKTNVSLIYKKSISVWGLDGIEIKYVIKSINSDAGYTCYHRIIYVNRTMYNYGFSTFDDSDKTSVAKKDAFLNSFFITEKKENLYQFYDDGGGPVERALAKSIANIIFYVIIGVAAFYIIKGLRDFFF